MRLLWWGRQTTKTKYLKPTGVQREIRNVLWSLISTVLIIHSTVTIWICWSNWNKLIDCMVDFSLLIPIVSIYKTFVRGFFFSCTNIICIMQYNTNTNQVSAGLFDDAKKYYSVISSCFIWLRFDWFITVARWMLVIFRRLLFVSFFLSSMLQCGCAYSIRQVVWNWNLLQSRLSFHLAGTGPLTHTGHCVSDEWYSFSSIIFIFQRIREINLNGTL